MEIMMNGHPIKIMLHPMVVHFPIAFFFLELLFLILRVVRNDREYGRFARFVFWMGFCSMLVAMAAGLWDAGGLANIRGPIRRHALAAVVVFMIQTLRALLYWRGCKDPLRYAKTQMALAVLGNAAVSYAGLLGGILVFD